MKKNITVVMKRKSKNHQPKDRIKQVARGYAFNYLIPKGMAEVATKGQIKHLHMLQEIALNKKNFAQQQSVEIKNKLNNIHAIHIRKKCSREQLIFGNVSEQDVAKRISELTGETIDKRQISIINSKKLGKYVVKIMVEVSIEASVNLCIIPKTM